MRKKFLGVIAVVAIAAVTGYNVYSSQNKNVELSDLALANVEALAQSGESGGMYYLNPCPTRYGAECSSKKYDDKNRCSRLTYC